MLAAERQLHSGMAAAQLQANACVTVQMDAGAQCIRGLCCGPLPVWRPCGVGAKQTASGDALSTQLVADG